jgi:hypothetical protein
MPSLSWSMDRGRVAVAAGLLAPLAACVALVPFRTSIPNTDAALLLVVVVVAVAAAGHRTAGILAAVSAAVWFDFFLTRPYERFSISSRNDIETAVLLLVVGAAVSELAARGRRHRIISITDQAYLAGIHTAAELVAAGAEPSAVVRHVGDELVRLLGLQACRFEADAFLGHPPRLVANGQLQWGANVWDIDQLGLPADEIELLARCNGRTHGRFMLTPVEGTTPSVGARQVAVVLADQVGASLEQHAVSGR